MEGGVYVNSKLFNKDGHLTEETIIALKFGTLNDEEMISMLEHIGNCEKCAGIFAESFSEDELAETPLGFEEKVQIKIKGKKQSKFEFSFYCAKVVVAASIALIMVFSNGLNFLANTKMNYIKSPDFSILNSVNAELNNFSEKVIKMEVFDYDKKKR